MRSNEPAGDLLDACIAAPDNDAPRLAWADAVGGERGEFVAIQCEFASGRLARETAIARRRREGQLLARHGKAWSGLDGLAEAWAFRRGFVEETNVDARRFMHQRGHCGLWIPATGPQLEWAAVESNAV